MGTIKISLRTDKYIKKFDSYPIELLYQIKGERRYYSTGQKVRKENWDAENQKAIFLDKKKLKILKEQNPDYDYSKARAESEIIIINDKLSELSQRIRRIERQYEDRKFKYTTEDVIYELRKIENNGKGSTLKTNNIFDFIDQYIIDHSATRVKGSLSVYKALRSHLALFDKRITFDKIDYHFFQRFQTFLVDKEIKNSAGEIIKQKVNNVTAAKRLSTLKTFLNYARLRGIEISDKYKTFKIKQEKLEVVALTNQEFMALYKLDLSTNKPWDQVRDTFCFSCATGLRYSDLKQLKRENIKDGELQLTIKKTKEKLSIPLTSYSQKILEKYSGMHKPLPVISNQKMNEQIKKICKKAGIDEPLEIVRYRGSHREAITYPKYELVSCHTGRKTFCTLCLERGMSAEETMAISGHTDYKSFNRYVKVTEQRKKLVMLKAWDGKGKLKAV